jgi:hypothetical protein
MVWFSISQMLALIYFAVAVLLGDRICRTFWVTRSAIHRLASAFLVGILISNWATYLLAVAFAWTARPLIWANLFFFAFGISFLFFLRKGTKSSPSRATKFNWRDAAFLVAFFVIACWLMFGTVRMRHDDIRLSSVVWNDFGPNLALIQSFALGHNFPAEYPYFTGEPIRYHFLFWFAAGNLEFLGLSPAWALNLLSVLSMMALLMSIMALGEALFGSRAIGAVAASLIFFQGSLSWVPFLRSQHSFTGVINSVFHLDHWLKSGFPYKGEDWGIWSPSILYVQRHLLGAIGIFCLVLIFLIDFYERKTAPNRDDSRTNASADETKLYTARTTHDLPSIRSFVFSGVLIGLLVFWNSAVYLCSLTVLGCLFLLFPGRSRVATLLGSAFLIGAPQIFLLGLTQSTQRSSILHWGYTIENPTLFRVAGYFLFTFGPKFVLALVALIFLGKTPRFLFLAMLSLVVTAFSTQLNVEIMNNQKFLYFWLILLNLFVAYALARVSRIRIVGKVAAGLLVFIVTAGGLTDLFRVHNDNSVDEPFRNNPLSKWILQNTKPTDVFLTERFVHHPILMNGRRIFYGWPYFPWSMGYATAERDELYRQMFTEQNPDRLLELLRHNGIDFVAIDDGLRNGYLHVATQENLFASHLAKVFQDTEKRFGNLSIYKVPR